MEKEERLAFRPQLLLLAPFLATLDVFVANLRVVRDITDAPESFGAVAVSMLVACALAGLVSSLFPVSVARSATSRAAAPWPPL